MTRRLTGLDAAFLALETPTSTGHVGGLSILDPSTATEPLTLERLTAILASRLDAVPVLRQRLQSVPLGIDQPVWVDDRHFDIGYHVRELGLPSPGSDEQLAEQVSRIHARPLDRERPLWETYLLSGLAGGRMAVYTKVHHAAVDGQAAVALAQALLDLGPRPRKVEAPPLRARKGRLGTLEMLRGALAHQLEQVVDLVKALPSTVGAVSQIAARTAGEAVGDGVDSLLARVRGTARRAAGVSNLGLAPRTRLNATVSNERAFAAVTLPLAELNAARRRQGASLNDALLAICSGALRRWFAEHGRLPRKSLVAAVPISLRSAGDATANTQASMSLVSLGTHLADPAARLAHVKAASASMKATVGSMRSLLPTDFPSLGVPWLMEGLTSIYGRAGLADRIPPLANVTISNVPGPTVPLWLAGAKLLADYPTSIVVHGVALNITVQSYHESLDIGIVACARAMPELAEFAAHIQTAFRELQALPAGKRPVSVTRATAGSSRVGARAARRGSR